MKAARVIFPTALLLAAGTVVAATQSDQGRQQGQSGFDKLDRNGDGMISRGEARAAPGLHDNFEQLDANADGVLSPEEVGVGGPGEGKKKQQQQE